MGYFIVRRGEEVSSYQTTSTANQPRLAMSNGYIPLVTGPTDNPTIVANTYGTTLRLGEYQTTSVRSTTTVQIQSTYGNAGTQTTTTAYYNSSVPSNNAGYNGVMSNTTALTQSSTSGYSGSSTRGSTSGYSGVSSSAAYYNATSAAKGALSSTAALTQSSTYTAYTTTTEIKVTTSSANEIHIYDAISNVNQVPDSVYNIVPQNSWRVTEFSASLYTGQGGVTASDVFNYYYNPRYSVSSSENATYTFSKYKGNGYEYIQYSMSYTTRTSYKSASGSPEWESGWWHDVVKFVTNGFGGNCVLHDNSYFSSAGNYFHQTGNEEVNGRSYTYYRSVVGAEVYNGTTHVYHIRGSYTTDVTYATWMQVDGGIEVTGPYGQTARKTTYVSQPYNKETTSFVATNITSTRQSVYGYSGRLSSQANYNSTSVGKGNLSNTTALTRVENYNTTAANSNAPYFTSTKALTRSSISGYSGRSSSTGTQSSTQSRSSFYTSQGSLSSTSSSVYSVQTTTTITVSTTAQSTTLTGGGYNVIGGAIVVNPGQPITCSVSSYSTQSAQTTDNRLSTYNTTLYTTVYLSKSSMCSSSYGAQTSSYATTSATTTVSSTTFA